MSGEKKPVLIRFTDDEYRLLQKVKEKLGFKLEGILREREYRGGEYLDMMCMAVLASDWKSEDEQEQRD